MHNNNNYKSENIWVAIPSYNRSDDLHECLDSLYKAGLYGEQIVVVDNASTDDTVNMIQKTFPSVNLIMLEKNLGATGASNAGFEFALKHGAAYVIRLDSDTIVDKNFLPPLLQAAKSASNIGMVSPKIYFHNNPDEIWYAGVDAQPLIFGAANEHRHKKDNIHNSKQREVAYIWAAAMLIKREVLEKTQGFDTDFFVYFEEIDFCERVRQLGYILIYTPNSHVWHKVGSTANSAWTAYQWNRSKMLLFRKQSKNFFHKIFLIFYAFSYALFDEIVYAIHIRNKRGNRGPLKHALKGLWSGLTMNLSIQK